MFKKIKSRTSYEWIYLRKITFSFKGIKVLGLVIRDSLKWCFQVNIGNYLRHEGKLVYVNNGVKIDSWDCLEVDKGLNIIRPDGSKAVCLLVPKKGARKVFRLSTPFNDFMQGFRFYMGYWYGIWVHGDSEYSKYKNRPTKIR